MKKAPCLNCTKRKEYCHSNCEDYINSKPTYKNEYDEAKAYLIEKNYRLKKEYGGR